MGGDGGGSFSKHADLTVKNFFVQKTNFPVWSGAIALNQSMPVFSMHVRNYTNKLPIEKLLYNTTRMVP